MKALQFEDERISVADVPVPRRDGEALVRVILSGICNTDLEIVRGYAGFSGTIGHEFVGVVEESADRPDIVGKRVVGEINAGCGECDLCSAGDARHCASRTVLGIVGRDGCHAEFLSLPSRNLLAVPDEVTDEQAVFAEPLAAAIGICEQVDIVTDTRVAVIGDGKLGLLCAMSLALRSDRVTAIGRHDQKLALLDGLGVETLKVDEIKDRERSCDVVVEASGSPSGFATALDLVRPRGKIVLKSTFHGEPTWAAARVVVDEITIVGSRCGRFAPAIDALATRSVPVKRLITAEFPLTDAVAAMDRAREPGTLKILLRP